MTRCKSKTGCRRDSAPFTVSNIRGFEYLKSEFWSNCLKPGLQQLIPPPASYRIRAGCSILNLSKIFTFSTMKWFWERGTSEPTAWLELVSHFSFLITKFEGVLSALLMAQPLHNFLLTRGSLCSTQRLLFFSLSLLS